MSFLRIDKRPSGQFLRIVQNYRQDGKVLQRTVHNLGKVEEYSAKELEQLGRKFMELSGNALPQEGELSLVEEGRHNYGFPLVVKHLVRKFGLDALFSRFDRAHRLNWRIFDPVCLMLCDRLCSPCSKRSSHSRQGEYLGLASVEAQHLYRSLDYLGEHNRVIQEHLFGQRRAAGMSGLDLVFYDVTTFYFQSEEEQEGRLRQKGFGKDGKVGKTQVLFGLLIDQKRNPVGYEVYAGDTYEGHTFSDSVEKLRRQYGVRRVVVVADSGMMSAQNLSLFNTEGAAAQGMEYIVGERLKALSKNAQDYLCDPNNYSTMTVRDDQGYLIPLRYALTKHKGKHLLATYSEKRARKDRAQREERIKKAKALLLKPNNIDKKARQFFLKPENDAKYVLDEEKIKNDARFDGILVIATNALDLTPQQALQQYKELYNIEQSFRSFKSFLQTRPMFHWTDARIKGHLCLCYIAFFLLAHLRNLTAQQDRPFSEESLRRTLAKMQVSKVIHLNTTHFLRASLDQNDRKLLNDIGITKLPNDWELPARWEQFLL